MKIVEQFRHKPILLWGLSGWRANGHFVTTADQAGTTALRAALAEHAEYVAAQTLSRSLELKPLAEAPQEAAEVEWGDGKIHITVKR